MAKWIPTNFIVFCIYSIILYYITRVFTRKLQPLKEVSWMWDLIQSILMTPKRKVSGKGNGREGGNKYIVDLFGTSDCFREGYKNNIIN